MDLGRDRRAQSVQIGALLLFVVVLIAFAGYQAVVVPQQNAQVEFDHDQRVQAEFVDVRNGAMTAAASGTSTFTEITLGTRYPARLVAMNPTAPRGEVRTTDPDPITVENADGPVCRGADETRHLEYRASYNAFDGQPTYRFENTVAYREFDDGVQLVDTGQRLVDDATINLVPIRGEFSRSGTGAVSVEPVPGRVRYTTVDSPTINVSTGLSAERWEELLEDELDGGESATVEDGRLLVELRGSYSLICSPVGIDRAPDPGARLDGKLDGGSAPGDVRSINPNGPRAVVLHDASLGENDELELTFYNRGDENRTFERGRFVFYYAADTIYRSFEITQTGDTLELREGYRELDGGEGIPIEGGNTTRLTLDFGFDPQDDPGLVGVGFVDDRNREELYVAVADDAEPDGVGDGFRSVSALDLDDDIESQEQTFEFELEDGLDAGSEVEIVLEDVSVGNRIRYPSGNESVTSDDDGDVSIAESDTDVEITYAVGDDGREDGATAAITVEDVDTTGNNAAGTYTATFARNDTGAQEGAEFTVE